MAKKYAYEIVRVPLKNGMMEMKPQEDYREIIAAYAEKGWRLKQIFAPPVSGYGVARYFDIIFEHETE